MTPDDAGRLLHQRYVDRLKANNFHHPLDCPGVPQGLGGAWGGIRCNACHPDVLEWESPLLGDKVRAVYCGDAAAVLHTEDQ